MCLVALSLAQSARFPLVLASNRDEFFDRPTTALDWWPSGAGRSDVLAGRDLQAGGTWLGLTPSGRLALVTNVRDGTPINPKALSRGALVPGWLAADEPFEQHWQRIDAAAHNGFNLIAADTAREEWFWAGSHGQPPRRLEAGLYGLSNAALDTPWPKVDRTKRALRDALSGAAKQPIEWLVGRLFAALGDAECADDASLPATGIPQPLERQLSAAFIRTPDGRYGTRCSTLVITEATARGRETYVIERSHGHAEQETIERRVRLAPWPNITDLHAGRSQGRGPIVERRWTA